MGYYIGTLNQCEAYNEKVKTGEKFGSVTTDWAKPISHPEGEQYAILKHKKYDDEHMQYVLELSEDWNPEDDLIL